MIQEKWLIVGHRGSGKSSFLRGLSRHFEHCIDLDDEIEKRTQKQILELFSKYGEESFRQLEAATLDAIIKENEKFGSVVIALGAGFRANIWPRDYRCLWLRKETDVWPRFFADRPQIATSDPENFLSHYIEREQRYQLLADAAWTFEEGSEALMQQQREWPLDISCGEGACLTLVPRLHKDPTASIDLRKNWNLRFELRSDLWPAEVIKKILAEKKVPLLLSVRTEKLSLDEVLPKERNNIFLDWDLAFGDVPDSYKPDIISLHDFSEGMKPALKKLNRALERYPSALLKAAPFVNTFEDLEILWKWREQNPAKHMVYPRTPIAVEHPKWQWFRLYLKNKQPLNFVREATEGPRDQPTIAQYQKHIAGTSFAAILGEPVFHSYSPLFHHDFFEKKKMSFLCIPLRKDAFSLQVFDFLNQLGAKAYAVTSPLKEHGVLLAKSKAADSASEKVCNTLVKKSEWNRFNTDAKAIEKIFKSSHASWRIWGSGAVAKQCFDGLEHAELYSARGGEKLEAKGSFKEDSFNLLWAAGDEAKAPPESWKPLKVYDLSYAQRSLAILYANNLKVDYENGLEFFKIQALAQQEHWSEL